MKELIDGNEATAHAVKLCRVECVPCFPITPQTELMETLAKWVAEEKIDIFLNVVESEHSVLSAAVGAEMTGNRTFTSSGSQGIMLMHEILPIASGTRMPIVMICGSRALSAPIALWPDHNDFLSCRDFGWIMLAAENNQEALDLTVIAYKVGENNKVLLPVLIEMDGFVLGSTREQVDIPSQKTVDSFLPPLRLETRLDTRSPQTLGVPVLHGYMEFKAQVHKAQMNAKNELERAFKEWGKLTKRKYGLVEEFYSKRARTVVVMMGANASIAKQAVLDMRKRGKKVGLVKLRVIRPFPEERLRKALGSAKKVVVVDQNISPGKGGVLYSEVRDALFGGKKTVSNCIVGLGGEPVGVKDFIKVIEDAEKERKGRKKWLV